MTIHILETGDGCKVTFNDMTGKARASYKKFGCKKWALTTFKGKTYQVLLKRILESLIDSTGEGK
jgi:hypothetical protein